MQEFSIRKTESVYFADVAVVGSGSGGLAAAISAAKQGAKVILFEKNGYLGGMAASGLPYLGYLDIKNRPAVGGFATQFVDELVKDNAAIGVRYCPKHLSVVNNHPDRVKAVAAKLLEENGVKYFLHSYLMDVKTENGKITAATFDCAGNRFSVQAKVFVDATGDGVLASLAGAEYEQGTAGVDLQPSSVIYTIGGVDKQKLFAWLEEHPEELEGIYTMDYLKQRPDFTLVTLNQLWRKINPKGEWPMKGIWAMIMMNRFNDSEVALNGPRIPATDATDAESITFAEVEGLKQATAFVETLRKYVGGFENAFLSHVNDSIGVRETRRVKGIKTLTIDKVRASVIEEDSVALGSYPVDIHSSKDNTSSFEHVENPFGIPYLCTVSSSFKNLMMSGRCVSADRFAFGSIRVMGTCFALGEAVGYGAALAVKQNVTPKDVNVQEIRELILKNGGILSVK